MRQGIKNLKQYGFNTDYRTYIVAEIGINHGGDLQLAKKLIDAAGKAGADAVKFQTYLTEKRAPKGNKAVFDILKNCELPFDAFRVLKDHAGSREIDFFSTPFDLESISFLEDIGCPRYKIASFDTVNLNLLDALARTSKPIVMSTGMSSEEEVRRAYNLLLKGTKKITLLHCVSAYPITAKVANLATIRKLKSLFDCPVGSSAHTPDIQIPLYAVAAGAQVVEKHLMLDEGMDCIDAPVSITEVQMKDMVAEIRRIEVIFGEEYLGVRPVEELVTIFRRPSEI